MQVQNEVYISYTVIVSLSHLSHTISNMNNFEEFYVDGGTGNSRYVQTDKRGVRHGFGHDRKNTTKFLERYVEVWKSSGEDTDLRCCEVVGDTSMLRIPLFFKYNTEHKKYDVGADSEEHSVMGSKAYNALLDLISQATYNFVIPPEEEKDNLQAYFMVASSPLVERKAFAYQLYVIYFNYVHFPSDVITKIFLPKLILELQSSDIASRFTVPFIGTWADVVCENYITGEVPLFGSSKDTYPVLRAPSAIVRQIVGIGEYEICHISEAYAIDGIGGADTIRCDIPVLEEIRVLDPDEYARKWEQIAKYYIPLLCLDTFYMIISSYEGERKIHSRSVQRPFGHPLDGEVEETPQDQARYLINLLSDERWLNVCDWLAIGRVLYNVFSGKEEGLRLWYQTTVDRLKEHVNDIPHLRDHDNIQSMMREYYNEQRTNQNPNNPREYIGIHTLEWFARKDCPEEYDTWFHQVLMRKVEVALECHDADIHACIAWYIHLTHLYATEGRSGTWYIYQNYMWVCDEESLKLRSNIQHDVASYLIKLLDEVWARISRSVESDANNAVDKKIHTQLLGLIHKIKSFRGESTCVKGLCSYLVVPHFNKISNANCNITPTGKYTLEIFRDKCYVRRARPQDYNTRLTGVPFNRHINENNRHLQEYHRILEQYYPDMEERMLFRRIVASGLYKGNPDKVILVFVGKGGDEGKSSIVNLLSAIFGDGDVIRAQTTLVTGGKSAPGAATPHLERADNTRFLIMDEGDVNTETIKAGVAKHLSSGSDRIPTRGLYSNKVRDIRITFVPLMILNQMLAVQNPDAPTRNRFIFIVHKTRFINPNKCNPGDIPTTPEEQRRRRIYPAISNFEDIVIPRIAEAVLWQAVQDYTSYVQRGYSKLPASSVIFAENFWRQNDRCTNFFQLKVCNAYIIKDDGGQNVRNLSSKLRTSDVYREFKRWYQQSYSGEKVPNLDVFVERVSIVYGAPTNDCWYGVRLREDGEDDDDDPLINEVPKPTPPLSRAEMRHIEK